MSVLGTNLAAAVAGTTLTAQQAATAKDKRAREARRSSRRLPDVNDAHLKVPEEHDEGEATPRLVVDNQLQENHPSEAPTTTPPSAPPRKRLDVTG